jgi:hypothetical protein
MPKPDMNPGLEAARMRRRNPARDEDPATRSTYWAKKSPEEAEATEPPGDYSTDMSQPDIEGGTIDEMSVRPESVDKMMKSWLPENREQRMQDEADAGGIDASLEPELEPLPVVSGMKRKPWQQQKKPAEVEIKAEFKGDPSIDPEMLFSKIQGAVEKAKNAGEISEDDWQSFLELADSIAPKAGDKLGMK